MLDKKQEAGEEKMIFLTEPSEKQGAAAEKLLRILPFI
jgi:hypothetical protein